MNIDHKKIIYNFMLKEDTVITRNTHPRGKRHKHTHISTYTERERETLRERERPRQSQIF
jgi:hypothetical protein